RTYIFICYICAYYSYTIVLVIGICLATDEARVLLHSFGCAFFNVGNHLNMAVFLIDYENESGNVLAGISLLGLKRNDEIIFFYSKNASQLTMDLHKELESVKAKKLYIEAEPGKKNALDFQLVSYLGACIKEYPKKKYYIVSKDGGFNCVCRFWAKRRVDVKRIDKFCYYIND
ncbi:MAG: hypothetical protein K2J59_00920, partial [Eubacterium sp.]|nr:hypothetical protein [Eubacterium sp.]